MDKDVDWSCALTRNGWRRFFLCAALLAAFPVIASAKDLDEALFQDAKDALTMISYGEVSEGAGQAEFYRAAQRGGV